MRILTVAVLLVALMMGITPTLADGYLGAFGKVVLKALKEYDIPVTPDDVLMEPAVFNFTGHPIPQRPSEDPGIGDLNRGLYDFVREDVNRAMPTNLQIVVVADVMSVTMIAVTGLDGECRVGNGFKSSRAKAWYRVTVHVRRVERGELMSQWLSFPVLQDSDWDLKFKGGWLFYRGITLRLELHREGAGLLLDRSIPVLPYPPYSAEDIQVYGGMMEWNMPEPNAFTRCDGVRRVLDTDDMPLAIQYGDHTLAVFVHGVDLLTERVAGNVRKFYDFGVSAKVHVWFNGSEGNEAYWRNAWFADHMNGSSLKLPSALTLYRIGEAETDGKGTNAPDSSSIGEKRQEEEMP